MLQPQQQLQVQSVNQKQQRQKQHERWRCDICRVLTFHSFQEACDHEAQCDGNRNNQMKTESNDTLLTEAIISLSSCSSSTPSMSPNEESSDTLASITATTSPARTATTSSTVTTTKNCRIRKQPDTADEATTALTGSTKNKSKPLRPQRQATITTLHQKAKISRTTSDDSSTNRGTPAKTTVLSDVTEDDVVQALEAVSPFLPQPPQPPPTTRATKKLKSSQAQIYPSQTCPQSDPTNTPCTVTMTTTTIMPTPSTNDTKTVKKRKNTRAASNKSTPGTIPKSKQILRKTPDLRTKNAATTSSSSSSKVYPMTMMDWCGILPTIRDDIATEESNEGNDVIHIDVDDTTNIAKKLEQQQQQQQQQETKFLNEQIVAYQFREERRKKQLAERDKQLRRQQHRMSATIRKEPGDVSQNLSFFAATDTTTHKSNVVDVVDMTQDTTLAVPTTTKLLSQRRDIPTTAVPSSKISTTMNAIRFPKQSHIISNSDTFGSESSSTSKIPVEVQSFDQPCLWWNRSSSSTSSLSLSNTHSTTTQPFHHIPSTLSMRQETLCSYSICTTGSCMESRNSNAALDLLQTAIYSNIISTSLPEGHSANDIDTRHNHGRDSTLWVDRYYNNVAPNHRPIRTDHCTSDAYDRLHDFIERFMLERQKVERANIEKQKKQRQNFFGHVPTSKKPKNHPVMAKKRRTTDDDDDDLWDDDECTNSNSAFDADLWSSLCVISGPVGCGKSNIVHRVAKELGCRKVVELHTGMKRNSATMKRIVEEATKSHSTFDMIQNQCKGATMDEESTLDDRGSAVTVILIDEVDNLDPDTDCGFWSALCDLYKESKCPIIVTCNSIPKELNATSFRWTHIPMYRPTPKQCAVQLRDILLQEGYTTRHAADVLVTIAQLGNCDVRRILQELQLFHVYTVSALSSTFCNDANDVGIVVQAGNVTRNTFPSNIFPIIESVHPNIIYFDRYTTITVKGTNFLSIIDLSEAKTMYHRCNVFIGSYCCPHAYVINDSTILAVVTPSVNMVSKYLPIYVSCTKRFGIISSTKNFITTIDLPDQSKMLATGQSYLVECRYGETADIDASDSEQEFDNDVRDEVACEKILECTSLSSSDPNKRRTSQTLNLDLTMQMLNESVHSFEARYGMPDEGHEANTTTFQKVTVDELAIIERVEALAGLASDASLFEDVGLNPVPFLSGSCRGFGFTYTEVFPKRTNECSKPPTEEQLFHSGWNDSACFYGTSDCHMTRYLSNQERKLLRWNELSIRGCSLQYSGLFDEEEADKYRESVLESSDEDYLLTTAVPTSLFDLPQILTASSTTLPCTFRYEFHHQQQKSYRTEVLHLLRDSLFTNPKYTRYSQRLELPATKVDLGVTESCMLVSDIFLDYLPLLRCMAVQESISEFIYKTQDVSNQNGRSTTRRRNTRLSIRLGREQYFDKIIPSYTLQASNMTTKEIVDSLASTSMLFKV